MWVGVCVCHLCATIHHLSCLYDALLSLILFLDLISLPSPVGSRPGKATPGIPAEGRGFRGVPQVDAARRWLSPKKLLEV